MAGGGLAIASLPLVETGCGPKVSFYIQTFSGALIELKPLLPGAAGLIGKAIAAASDFDKQYRRGDFTSAIVTLQSLSADVSEIANDAGVDSPKIKGIIAVAGIALRAVAAILAEQQTQPAVAAGAAAANSQQQQAVREVKRLAASVDRVFAVIK